MLVPELILQTLEDMLEDDYKKFRWYLTMKISDSFEAIPKSRVENACRMEAVSKMIESYGEEMTMNVTEYILKKMQQINAAKKLRTAYMDERNAPPSTTSSTVTPPAAAASISAEEINAPPSTTSSTVTPPAAAASISAQHGSVIIAPTLSSGTTGSWNITIHKP